MKAPFLAQLFALVRDALFIGPPLDTRESHSIRTYLTPDREWRKR